MYTNKPIQRLKHCIQTNMMLCHKKQQREVACGWNLEVEFPSLTLYVRERSCGVFEFLNLDLHHKIMNWQRGQEGCHAETFTCQRVCCPEVEEREPHLRKKRGHRHILAKYELWYFRVKSSLTMTMLHFHVNYRRGIGTLGTISQNFEKQIKI